MSDETKTIDGQDDPLAESADTAAQQPANQREAGRTVAAAGADTDAVAETLPDESVDDAIDADAAGAGQASDGGDVAG